MVLKGNLQKEYILQKQGIKQKLIDKKKELNMKILENKLKFKENFNE